MESWLLRSQLKADIRTQIRNLKSLFPDRFTGTAQELQSKVKDIIHSWVRDGLYLHDVIPGSVRVASTLHFFLSQVLQDDQLHFAHPIIASTSQLFYFDKWSEISTHDQDTFKGSVPKPLIALIDTVVRFICTQQILPCYSQHPQYRNTLDEWSNSYPSMVKLEWKLYKGVYDEILRAMTAVEDDPIDGPCLHEHLAVWARFGM